MHGNQCAEHGIQQGHTAKLSSARSHLVVMHGRARSCSLVPWQKFCARSEQLLVTNFRTSIKLILNGGPQLIINIIRVSQAMHSAGQPSQAMELVRADGR